MYIHVCVCVCVYAQMVPDTVPAHKEVILAARAMMQVCANPHTNLPHSHTSVLYCPWGSGSRTCVCVYPVYVYEWTYMCVCVCACVCVHTVHYPVP